MPLHIENDGPLIRNTDYWQSDHAKRGLAYVSINAGAVRLLLPPALESALDDMRTAREVVISRGPWPAERRADALELLFDDGSASPFALHLDARQCDRVIGPESVGRRMPLTVWVAQHGQTVQVLATTCVLRHSRQIPDLSPWRGK